MILLLATEFLIHLYFSWHLTCHFTDLGGFPGGSDGKESAVSAGDTGGTGPIPEPGKSPREGNGHPLQYSCLENPMDRGAWWATVHGVAKSRRRLSDYYT